MKAGAFVAVFFITIEVLTVAEELSIKNDDAGRVRATETQALQRNKTDQADAESDELLNTLSGSAQCAATYKAHCSDVEPKSDLTTLTCLYNAAQNEAVVIPKACQEVLWEYRSNMITNPNWNNLTASICQSDLGKFPQCTQLTHEEHDEGMLIPCLLDHISNLTDSVCQHFISQVGVVYFHDFHLMRGFYKECSDEVVRLKCGTLDRHRPEYPHNQGSVLDCLEEEFTNLAPSCKTELLHLEKIMADSFQLDRSLYFACRTDKEVLCKDVSETHGKSVECLFEHIDDTRLSGECRKQLVQREEMVMRDVEVDPALWLACKADYDQNQCDKRANNYGTLENLLVCLRNAMYLGHFVSLECQEKVRDESITLVKLANISPDVLLFCEKDLKIFCNNTANRLHCLLNRMPKGDLSERCVQSIMDFERETGASTVYRIDPMLEKVCREATNSLCADSEDTFSCLFDNLDSPHMDFDCQNELHIIIYLHTKDIRLDKELYAACHDDAQSTCNAPSFNEQYDGKKIVFSCLYRHAVKELEETMLSLQCQQAIKRVIVGIANDVRLLMPVLNPCMADLSKFCTVKEKEDASEMDCLENNYDRLSAQCRTSLGYFISYETLNVDANTPLHRACRGMIENLCQQSNSDDHESIWKCLLSKKRHPAMSDKCAAAIQHWQMILAKDFKLNPGLVKSCGSAVEDNCKSIGNDKMTLLRCLSGLIALDASQSVPNHRISQECRFQLHTDLVVQMEDLRLDPKLEAVCKEDYVRLCYNSPFEGAQKEECLRSSRLQLSSACSNQLFEHEKLEAMDEEFDVFMITTCKADIMQFCRNVPVQHVSSCLRAVINKISTKCQSTLYERLEERAEDSRLDVELRTACKLDLNRVCVGITDSVHNPGAIINCLKEELLKQKLTKGCASKVRERVREASVNLNLDPKLKHACMDEISKLCPYKSQTEGEVAECLKDNLKVILSKECRLQVVLLIQHGREDIHADQHLFEACFDEIHSKCKEGEDFPGKVVKCLLDLRSSRPEVLTPVCTSFLQERSKLWAVTHTQVTGISDIATAVELSPHREYIYLVLLAVVLAVFVFGLVFGRVTKRVAREIKMR